jgi:hypothetical protein
MLANMNFGNVVRIWGCVHGLLLFTTLAARDGPSRRREHCASVSADASACSQGRRSRAGSAGRMPHRMHGSATRNVLSWRGFPQLTRANWSRALTHLTHLTGHSKSPEISAFGCHTDAPRGRIALCARGNRCVRYGRCVRGAAAGGFAGILVGVSSAGRGVAGCVSAG